MKSEKTLVTSILIVCEIVSSDVVPCFQQLKTGDRLPLYDLVSYREDNKKLDVISAYVGPSLKAVKLTPETTNYAL